MYSPYYHCEIPEELGKKVKHGDSFIQKRYNDEVTFRAWEHFLVRNSATMPEVVAEPMSVFLNMLNSNHDWVPETEIDILFAKSVERVLIFMSEEDLEWFQGITDPEVKDEDAWKRICDITRQSDGYVLSLLKSNKEYENSFEGRK